HGAVLNAGHIPAVEVDALVPAAHAAGIDAIVVSHPTFMMGADPERCAGWVRQGAVIEHCLAFAVNRPESSLTREALAPYLDACGVEGTVFSSDLGQAGNILPVTGFRRMVRRLLNEGMPADDIHRMVATNSQGLLGLA